MATVKNISFYILMAIAMNFLAKWLDSDFVGPFLKNNIVSVLINLLAINIATCTILLTKLNELKDKHATDFSATIKELKFSLKEQVILIAVSFVALMLDKSSVLVNCIPQFSIYVNVVLTAVFIYAIDILWDIGKAVFTIINH